MKIIAGVDIGNSTTEVCIGAFAADGQLRFLSSASCPTTGMKGTLDNVRGIQKALALAAQKAGKTISDIQLIRINEAAPVIGDTAMETLTETIIADSSMIGHNPSTPAGMGCAVGHILHLNNLTSANPATDYILVADNRFDFETIANRINQYAKKLFIVGLILQADEAVLVENRLEHKIPIVDEVRRIELIPEGQAAAIEVAMPGQSVRTLSNPYGIASLLSLTPEETERAVPIAKSLIGLRSAVVVKTPEGNVRERVLPAGDIYIEGTENDKIVALDDGAQRIMEALNSVANIQDIRGKQNTNVGEMLNRVRQNMADLSDISPQQVKITDILAVDTMAPVLISGALAGESCMEKAVAVAAMVKTQKLPMQEIARQLRKELGIPTEVAGVEAVMASLGALTTPGTQLPLAILDLGGGSTDAAVLHNDGRVSLTHQAGAGELVSMLIQTELGLSDRATAEMIKRYPLAKVESLFHLKLEDGQVLFSQQAYEPRLFGRVVMLAQGDMIRLEKDIPMERIVQVRREAKKKVFLANALRALQAVVPDHSLKNIGNVVLVGGSAEDFEIPEMLTQYLSQYKIVCGRGNIRNKEGARNAVATGLVLSYTEKIR